MIRSREAGLVAAALVAMVLGCGDSVLVARELDALQADELRTEERRPDAAAPLSDAGLRRKQARNAKRARARANARYGNDHGDGKKR